MSAVIDPGAPAPARASAPVHAPRASAAAEELIVAFAGASNDGARQALRELPLPGLQRLLAALQPAGRDDGSELSFTPPHEHALARARGGPFADGSVPLAGWLAQHAALPDAPAQAWCLLTPVHLHVGTEQVTLTDPAALALDADASRLLFDAVRPLFDSEGFGLHWVAPLQWLASHPLFDGLPTASLDRVIGRHIDRWLPDAPAARLLRRLQNEVQMLLYTHPHNDTREAAGLPSVNSFWASGSGRAPALAPEHGTARLEATLRHGMLNEDWQAWRQAWAALDGSTLRAWAQRAEAGEPVRLVLCGERAAAHFEARPRPWWQRWQARLARPPVAGLLESL